MHNFFENKEKNPKGISVAGESEKKTWKKHKTVDSVIIHFMRKKMDETLMSKIIVK